MGWCSTSFRVVALSQSSFAFFYSFFELVLNMLCAFGAKEGASLRQNRGLVVGCSDVRQLTAVALHLRLFIPSRVAYNDVAE